MNVVIYDTQHFETTYAYIRIFDTEGCKLTLFITPEMEQPLKDNLGSSAERFNWMVRRDSKLSHAKQLYRTCLELKPTYLVFTTISEYHLVYGFICLLLSNTQTLIVIHDANSFFKPAAKFSLRSIAQYTGLKLLRWTVKSYTALLSTTQLYIKESFQSKKPVYRLPGGVFEMDKSDEASFTTSPAFEILIPGSVDVKRRNYEEVFRLAELLTASKRAFKIILLGQPKDKYGLSIIGRIKSLKNTSVEFVYFEEFVEQSTFNRYLSACDVVWLPLIKEFINDSNGSEQYGVSKASGAFFDAVRYAKPILIPSYIAQPVEFTQQMQQYSSMEELASILEELSLRGEAYKNLVKQASENVLNFTQEAIREQNSLFKKIQ